MKTFDWIQSYPHCVTVSDSEGIIIAMNQKSMDNFKKYGGKKLIGSSLFACHPEPANEIIRNQLASREENTYITESSDKTRLINQVPWYHDDDCLQFGGLVETIINLAHGSKITIKKR